MSGKLADKPHAKMLIAKSGLLNSQEKHSKHDKIPSDPSSCCFFCCSLAVVAVVLAVVLMPVDALTGPAFVMNAVPIREPLG